jgi:hypothetical protein
MPVPDFSPGEVLTAAAMDSIGMWKVASTTFSASSGVEMQNCFTSNYDNYLVITNVFGSAGTNTNFQMMTGTNTKETTAVYYRVGFYWTSSITNFNGAAQNQWFNINHGTSATSYSNSEMTVFRPNVSGVKTEARLRGYSGDSDLTVFIDQYSTPTVSYTGLYLFPASGTITGTITIYGYRK